MPTLFFSYAHKDEALRDELEVHLKALERQGIIETWHDRRIPAGEDWQREIDQHLAEDEIILLLITPDFIASDYCYGIELRRALERHEAGAARVIPVIMRPCDWQDLPFGKLQATPKDGRPVKKFPNQDDAFLEVTRAIKRAVEDIEANSAGGGGFEARLPSARRGGFQEPAPAFKILSLGPMEEELPALGDDRATRFKTGETSPYKATFRFDGYLDGSSTPAPTAEEKEIPMDKGDTFPPIRSANKGCWWKRKS